MAETYTAGYVTAYGAAVRGGYTGTYEEFCAEQAKFGENAAAVAQAKTDVETMQDQVEQAAATFTDTTVPAAVATVQAEGATQVQAVQGEGTMQAAAVETVGAQQKAAVEAAGADAVGDVEDAEAAAVAHVQAESSALEAAIDAETAAREAGDSLLGEELNSIIAPLIGRTALTFQLGRYRTASATNTGEVAYLDESEAASGYVFSLAPCAPGDLVNYHIWGSVGICRGIFFCDANMVVLQKNCTTSQELTGSTPAPRDTAFVVVNHNLTLMPGGYYAYVGDNTVDFRSSATTLTSADDLDTITAPGVYWWAISSNVPLNSPTAIPSAMLVFGGTATGSRGQAQLIINTQSRAFMRYRSSDGWGAWNVVDKLSRTLAVRSFSGDGLLSLGLTAPYDLDLISDMAVCMANSSTTFANDPPFAGLGGIFMSLNGDDAVPMVQLFFASDNSAIFCRTKISTGWFDWQTIYSQDTLRGYQQANLALATRIGYQITSSNKWDAKASKQVCVLLTVPEGMKKVSFTPRAPGTAAFLRSYSADTATGDTPDFSREYFGDRAGTSFGKRIVFQDSGRVEYRLYDDVKYIYFLCANTAGDDLTPTDIVFSRDATPTMLQELPSLYLYGDIAGMTKSDAVTLDYSLFGQTGTCSCKWQGSSSQRYVKKNYTIKFDTGLDAWNKWASYKNALRVNNGNSSSVVTTSRWGSQTKYCFKANWIDPSHARNIVCARLWGQIVKNRVTGGGVTDNRKDAPNYGAINGFPMQIVLNGESLGLYTMNIPKDGWLFNMGSGAAEYVVAGENNSSAACRWKATAAVDGSDYSVEYAPNGVTEATVAASLNTAISAAINAGADWETALAPYLDVDSVFDYFIFTCCVNNHDALARNILYGTYDGTKWFMSAYDLDTTFGVDPYGTTWFDVVNDRNQFAQAAAMHQLAYLMVTYSPAKLKARYQELRAGILSEANVWKEFSNFIVDIPTRDYDIDRNIWPSAPGTATANMAQYLEYYRMHCDYLDNEIAAL